MCIKKYLPTQDTYLPKLVTYPPNYLSRKVGKYVGKWKGRKIGELENNHVNILILVYVLPLGLNFFEFIPDGR